MGQADEKFKFRRELIIPLGTSKRSLRALAQPAPQPQLLQQNIRQSTQQYPKDKPEQPEPKGKA